MAVAKNMGWVAAAAGLMAVSTIPAKAGETVALTSICTKATTWGPEWDGSYKKGTLEADILDQTSAMKAPVGGIILVLDQDAHLVAMISGDDNHTDFISAAIQNEARDNAAHRASVCANIIPKFE